MVGRDGVAPPEPFDNRFTVCPAPTYGIPTHLVLCFDIKTAVAFALCLFSKLFTHTFVIWYMSKFAWAIAVIFFECCPDHFNNFVIRIDNYFHILS